MERLDIKTEGDNGISGTWIAVIFMIIISVVSFISGFATGTIWKFNKDNIEIIQYDGKTYLYFQNKGVVEK